MKAFFGVLVLALIQTSLASYIRIPDCGCSPPIIAPINPCNPCINPVISPISPINPVISPICPTIPPISVIQSNSVANSLADTLSLLTVSSLLADSLPLGPNVVVPACGCGCGYGPIYY